MIGSREVLYDINSALIAACQSKSNNIQLYRNHIAVDLLIDANGSQRRCVGVSVLSETSVTPDTFVAPSTMLATGGIGTATAGSNAMWPLLAWRKPGTVRWGQCAATSASAASPTAPEPASRRSIAC